MMAGFLDPVTLLVFGATVLFIHWLLKEPANLPPGPRRWPVLGSLLSMTKYPMEKGHLAMKEFAEKYGGLFTLKLGSLWMVVVADPDIAREVFVKKADKFSDRPVYSGVMKKSKEMFGGEFGVIWASGDNRKEVRKFTISAMREFGFGKQSLIERIVKESKFLCEEVKKLDGQAWNPRALMSEAVSNIICSICFGERYAYDDPEFVKLMSLLHKVSESTNFVNVGMFFEWLSFLPPNKQARENIATIFELQGEIAKKIEEHEKTYDPASTRDFIDLYIRYKEENHGSISGQLMKMIILDLYFAGSDTTGTALTWLLKFLIAHPQVQDRCREEVDQVIGRDRSPEMSDKAAMPYVEATLNETLRFSSTAPVSLPHYATESTNVRGYTVPAGSNVILAIYPINMDPRLWADPEQFRPERWISETGECVSKNDNFLPFSLGQRVCLGEGLARQELFLFFTSLLQNFTFHKENADDELDFDSLQGITLRPTDYKLVAKPR